MGQARNNLQEKRKTEGQAPEDIAKPNSRKIRMSCEKKERENRKVLLHVRIQKHEISEDSSIKAAPLTIRKTAKLLHVQNRKAK